MWLAETQHLQVLIGNTIAASKDLQALQSAFNPGEFLLKRLQLEIGRFGRLETSHATTSPKDGEVHVNCPILLARVQYLALQNY